MIPLSRADRLAVLRIILAYAVFAGLWIYLSDTALGLLDLDRAALLDLSVYKGLLFILVTSVLLYQLVGRRVREVRRAEGELTESRRLVDALVEGTSDAIYVKDREGRYLVLNGAAARMTGRAPGEVLGRDDRALLPPAQAEGIAREDRSVMEGGESRTFEEELTLPDGKTRTFLTTKGPVRDGEGKVTGLFGIARDITSRKALEEQLRQAQKMEALGRLAGGVAHDFNNLLAVIRGWAELGAARTSPGDPLHDYFRDIHAAGESASSLTRQLLAFSRRQELRPEAVELNALVARTEKMLRRIVGGNVRIETKPAPGLWTVRADPSQLEQVLVNLVLNGRDAMPAGGRITIATENVSLVETDGAAGTRLPPGDYVLLEVADEGIGMDPATQERVFEPFFTTKEGDKGTGLGLSTVLGIVEQSGGAILLESEPGRGSAFRIFLPRREGGDDGREDGPATPRGPGEAQ